MNSANMNNNSKSKRPYDYLLSGYYGCENFGDNLTLECMMHHLRGKKGGILTCDLSRTSVPQEVKKIHRFSMKEISRTMKETKVFLMGCGSLFQDATSFRSFFYYYVVFRMALRNRCKTMLYANGIGPITRKSNLLRLKYILKRADCVTVRDQKSYDFLMSIGCKDRVYLTADDSFSYPIEELKPIAPPKEAEGRRIVGFNLRIATDMNQNELKALAETLSALAEKHHLYYYFIPFHYEQDSKNLWRIAELIPKISKFIGDSASPSQLLPYIASAEIQIFERLHGQILSTILGVPYLPISYDPKITAFAHQVGMDPYLLDHQNLDHQSLIDAFEKVLKDREIIQEKLNNYTKTAREKVRLNRDNLLKLIEEN